MQIMLRDRSLAELTESLRGKRVLIWTCNTCARLCEVGGSSNAQRLATSLRSEGIDVVSVTSSKAACLMSSAKDSMNVLKSEFDVVLALTCSAGARTASEAFGCEVVNPVATLGLGFIDGFNRPILIDGGRELPLELVSREKSLELGPF